MSYEYTDKRSDVGGRVDLLKHLIWRNVGCIDSRSDCSPYAG